MRLEKNIIKGINDTYEIVFSYLNVYCGYLKEYKNNNIIKQVIFNKLLGDDFVLDSGLDNFIDLNKRKYWL